MGVCTFLVSDQSKSYFDLGKYFMDDDDVDMIKMDSEGIEDEVAAWLQSAEYNHPLLPSDARVEAVVIAAWMKAHQDWRFLSDTYRGFDDVYLAIDAEDADEYVAEFGEEAVPIYVKDGSIGASDDKDDSEDMEDEGEDE